MMAGRKKVPFLESPPEGFREKALFFAPKPFFRPEGFFFEQLFFAEGDLREVGRVS